MQRILLNGTVASAGTQVKAILATADMKPDHSILGWFLTFSSQYPCEFVIRSIDNDVDLTPTIMIGEDDIPKSFILPMAQIPWIVSPQGDGLEIYVLGTHASGNNKWEFMIGISELMDQVLEQRTTQPVIP